MPLISTWQYPALELCLPAPSEAISLKCPRLNCHSCVPTSKPQSATGGPWMRSSLGRNEASLRRQSGPSPHISFHLLGPLPQARRGASLRHTLLMTLCKIIEERLFCEGQLGCPAGLHGTAAAVSWARAGGCHYHYWNTSVNILPSKMLLPGPLPPLNLQCVPDL